MLAPQFWDVWGTLLDKDWIYWFEHIVWASGGFTIPLIADAVMDFNPVALTQSSFTSAVCWFWYGVTHGAPRASSGHRDRGSAVCFSGLGAFFSFTFWCYQNSEHWLTLSRTELMKWGILIWIISCTVIMFPNIDIFFTYLPLTAGGGVNTKHPLDTKKKDNPKIAFHFVLLSTKKSLWSKQQRCI